MSLSEDDDDGYEYWSREDILGYFHFAGVHRRVALGGARSQAALRGLVDEGLLEITGTTEVERGELLNAQLTDYGKMVLALRGAKVEWENERDAGS